MDCCPVRRTKFCNVAPHIAIVAEIIVYVVILSDVYI